MKLRIEKWAEETKPFKESDSAHDFFEESVRCYKIGAYKSAFVMSYLAFKTIVRNRILECPYGKEAVSSNPNPLFWENELIKKLENDDSWESSLNTIVEASCADENNRKPIGILHFTNGEQTKSAYNYWRDIRNDCVHAKKQVTIDSSTVESFWNYLIDNLNKFYVLGGEQYTLKELENIYKYYSYPDIVSPERVTAIINDLNVTIKKKSKNFFHELFTNLRKNEPSKLLVKESNITFWKDILESKHENIIEGIIEEISATPFNFFNFYKYFPQVLELAISVDSKFIVERLSDWLCEPFYFLDNNQKMFWKLLVETLDRYNGIYFDKILYRTIALIASFEPDERKLRILNQNNIFKKYIFEQSPWFFKTDSNSQYDNYHKLVSDESHYIECCFNYLDWDIECIKTLNSALDSLEYSMAYRSNPSSYSNGKIYQESCKRIICNNKEKILSIPNVDLSNYNRISKIINECDCSNNE
ncbi:hypothetical protein LOZ80_00790 [Paenibacillus sp. HWE-109]|uniref:hypothetical protein n=1 Tax=Paenibacillus sp. HWE-109 TaxID=1306526 RepID=UPI001EE0C206|nr:hypothetical protein [Paenibacillus sp. HWE-109]UKS27521.1 hypothetical protein LOZ80_00790 [Paenibacillus sp. HWE-109]